MSKKKTPLKYCNCNESSNKEILKSKKDNSFCEKCGSIILKSSNGTLYYLLKSKQKRVYKKNEEKDRRRISIYL